MKTKSSIAKEQIPAVSWRGSRNARSVLLAQMAEEAEKLAAIGARIAALRSSLMDPETDRRLSQSALATAIGVSYRTVQNWEGGVGVRAFDPGQAQALSAYFRRRGIEHATETYILDGVVERAPTPDTLGVMQESTIDIAALSAQLDRIEGMLIEALGREVKPPVQPVADAAQPPGELGRRAEGSGTSEQDRRPGQNRKAAGKRRGAGE